MKELSRRAFVKMSFSTLATLSLVGCGGATEEPAPQQKSDAGTSETSESTFEPGHVTSSGTLITPYDEGYSSGTHHATIEVADYGTIKVELDADVAPITVSNFAHLVNEGFYTDTTFHRIIKGFMIQGGAPKQGTDASSMVHVLGEFSDNGKTNDISHVRGTISMARATNNNSGSSGFFITDSDRPDLDGRYAAFGHVTEGMDVVDKIANVPVQDDNGTVATADQPHIASIVMDD